MATLGTFTPESTGLMPTVVEVTAAGQVRRWGRGPIPQTLTLAPTLSWPRFVDSSPTPPTMWPASGPAHSWCCNKSTWSCQGTFDTAREVRSCTYSLTRKRRHWRYGWYLVWLDWILPTIKIFVCKGSFKLVRFPHASTGDGCISSGRLKISYLCIDAAHCGKCRPLHLVWINLNKAVVGGKSKPVQLEASYTFLYGEWSLVNVLYRRTWRNSFLIINIDRAYVLHNLLRQVNFYVKNSALLSLIDSLLPDTDWNQCDQTGRFLKVPSKSSLNINNNFGLIEKNDSFYLKLMWILFGKNRATFYFNIWSHWLEHHHLHHHPVNIHLLWLPGVDKAVVAVDDAVDAAAVVVAVVVVESSFDLSKNFCRTTSEHFKTNHAGLKVTNCPQPTTTTHRRRLFRSCLCFFLFFPRPKRDLRLILLRSLKSFFFLK